jgi:hypothetical protein
MEGTEEEKEKVKKKKKKIKKLPNPTSRLSLTEWRKALEDFRMGYISRRVSVESSSAPTANFYLLFCLFQVRHRKEMIRRDWAASKGVVEYYNVGFGRHRPLLVEEDAAVDEEEANLQMRAPTPDPLAEGE